MYVYININKEQGRNNYERLTKHIT
jgi:hypothetical protein